SNINISIRFTIAHPKQILNQNPRIPPSHKIKVKLTPRLLPLGVLHTVEQQPTVPSTTTATTTSTTSGSPASQRKLALYALPKRRRNE
ncbi:hypothetical protein OFB79_25795, partial [Escherichia coli]|nr:hypothetical protein [Escherichia coli]